MKDLVIAWLASSAAFSIAFVGFMMLWVWSDDGSVRPLSMIWRLSWLSAAAALVVQFVYGGLIYVLLTRTGLWSLWTVALVYLLPVLIVGWFTIDTEREAWGMIAWVIFACLVAFVSWFLAPVQIRHTAD